jgi:type I restriction enzyme S subunit
MSANVELPREWRQATVDESIRIIDYRGRTPPFDGTVIPHLRSQNVKSGRIVWEDLAYVSEDTYAAFMTRGIPQTGDILFTTEAPLGEVAPVPDQKFSVAQRIMVLRPSPQDWSPLFLMYQLMSPEVQARIRRKGTGSTVTGVASRNFKPLALRVAPLPEQRRIVAEIEKQFTRLEAGVAALRRVQANLKRYRAAVLKAACEGRLVPTEAELHRKLKTKNSKVETGAQLLARILTERRQNWQGRGQYKEPAAVDTAKLFELPADWTWATLDALAEIKGGITKNQNRKHTAPVRSVPYLRVANVQRGYIDLREVKEIITTEDEIQELALKPGDILFNEGGDRDKLGRGWVWNAELSECIHQNHVFRARLHVPELNPKLVSWYANTFGQKFFFDEGKHTTNLASISMSKLKGLPVPIPPPAEQTRIVAEVERANISHRARSSPRWSKLSPRSRGKPFVIRRVARVVSCSRRMIIWPSITRWIGRKRRSSRAARFSASNWWTVSRASAR